MATDEVLAVLVVPVLEDLPLVVGHVRVPAEVLALEDRRGHRRGGGPLAECGQDEKDEDDGSGRHCVIPGNAARNALASRKRKR